MLWKSDLNCSLERVRWNVEHRYAVLSNRAG
nr:MAG TPA: hypothetical protein [Caudoviricetes sp.]